MGVTALLSSADVDVATEHEIAEVIERAGLDKKNSAPYIEVCPLNTFRTAPDWRSRAHVEHISGIDVLFPHPIDILVSKVKRCEEKDLIAFEEVIKATGHPTEIELKESLQRAVEIYRPGFDESTALDPMYSTEVLWQRLYGKEINVREEIIIPGKQKTLNGLRGRKEKGEVEG